MAGRCRTLSYSLCGDIGSGLRLNPRLGFDNYVRQLDSVLDRAGLARTALCGVSFGGFVALRYAALRPDRVSALVLASAPGPRFEPNPQQARWLAKPWLSVPAFLLTAPMRLFPEIREAIPAPRNRAAFLAAQAARCVAAPAIPSVMASRMRMSKPLDFTADCGAVQAPTLVVTGEPHLDRVVPVASTLSYVSLIPNARYERIPHTGHLGVVTRPQLFTSLVTDFVHAHRS